MATKSNIMKGMGVALSIIQTMTQAVKEAGGDDVDLHKLALPETECLWSDFGRNLIRFREDMAETVFKIDVNYGQSLQAAISEVKPSHQDNSIGCTDDQPLTRNILVKTRFRLFHFNKPIGWPEVEKMMEKENWQPANLRELLAFGALNKRLQKWFPVVALKAIGPAWSGRDWETIAGLWPYGNYEVMLTQVRRDKEFGKHWRFLAIQR